MRGIIYDLVHNYPNVLTVSFVIRFLNDLAQVFILSISSDVVQHENLSMYPNIMLFQLYRPYS